MAKAKSVAIPVSIRRQLASLNHRVSWLEAALRPKADKPPIDFERADRDRKWAEQKAHDDAMREYHEQERIERYRKDPELVKIAFEIERNENAFLRSRGLQPKPSDIPMEFQRRTKAPRKRAPARS